MPSEVTVSVADNVPNFDPSILIYEIKIASFLDLFCSVGGLPVGN
jgi:hypothetical protein